MGFNFQNKNTTFIMVPDKPLNGPFRAQANQANGAKIGPIFLTQRLANLRSDPAESSLD